MQTRVNLQKKGGSGNETHLYIERNLKKIESKGEAYQPWTI